jgi:hypothetical protein
MVDVGGVQRLARHAIFRERACLKFRTRTDMDNPFVRQLSFSAERCASRD